MHDLTRDMGRVLEAVEQNYKTQESLWKVMNQNKRDISSITVELKVLTKSIQHLESVVHDLKVESQEYQDSFQELHAEYLNNKRWIRGIVGVLATVLPLILSQVHSKLEELKHVDTRLNSVEWIVKRETDEPIHRIFESVKE